MGAGRRSRELSRREGGPSSTSTMRGGDVPAAVAVDVPAAVEGRTESITGEAGTATVTVAGARRGFERAPALAAATPRSLR